jgi:hypothetical protein
MAAVAAVSIGAIMSAPAYATVQSNASLATPPGFVNGTGNTNDSFQIDSIDLGNGQTLELGLRAVMRHVGPITPEGGNTNVYDAPTGNAAGRALWNFDFSITVLGTATSNPVTLASLTDVMLTITGGGLTNSFNPLNGAGQVTDNAIASSLGIDAQQNSENLGFSGFLTGFDPNAIDSYVFTLTATGNGQIASDSITVNAVPEPATLTLLGAGLLGLAAVRRKRRA